MYDLTRRAEEVLEIIEHMQMLTAMLDEYCTGECRKCPLKSECLGDAQFDMGAKYDIEKCADFVDYWDRYKAEQAQEDYEAEKEKKAIEAWEEANRWAGVDPQWMKVR